MKTGYYGADEIFGVYYLGLIAPDNGEILSPPNFYRSLRSAGEPIYTYLSHEDKPIYDQIYLEYGING